MKILLRLQGSTLLALVILLHGSSGLEQVSAASRPGPPVVQESQPLTRLRWTQDRVARRGLPVVPTVHVDGRLHWAAYDVAPDSTVWAVFVQRPGDGERWPTLALDLDRDGHIGEVGELFRSTELDPRRATQRWYVGDLPSDDASRPHTQLEIWHHGWTFRWRLRWYGGDWLYGGGAATVEESFLAFDPADAPHFDLHMGGDGPEWVPVRSRPLAPGATQRLAVLIGSRGRGPLSTSAFSESRVPSGWTPRATVRYEDVQGRPRSVSTDLPWASCGITREGLVDVPHDLDPRAPVRVEIRLPAGCPTRIPDATLTWPTVGEAWPGDTGP